MSVKVEGLDKLITRMQQNTWYATPWRDMMRRSMNQVTYLAMRRAPVASGQMAAEVNNKMDASPVPLWAIVTDNATSARGARYPFILDAGKGKGGSKLHYAGTRKVTKNWFRGSLTAARKQIAAWIDEAAREVERLWRT